MSLLLQTAPDFTCPTVMGDNQIEENFNFHSYIAGKKAILFFYPLDFTFVCPSEIIAFDKKLEEFTKRGCRVVGVSVDSHFSHLAWKNTPLNNGGIGQIKYPIVSDIKKNIARSYDCLFDESVAFRGTFLIDQDKKVRHILINDLPLGRSIDEAIRMVDALNFFEQHGEVCPANWKEGEKGMKPTHEGVSEYLSQK